METLQSPTNPVVESGQLASTASELDMSPQARLERTQEVQGRLAAGETIELTEVSPKTHCPEIVALVHQQRRHGSRAEF